MNKKILSFGVFILLLVISGCGNKAQSRDSYNEDIYEQKELSELIEKDNLIVLNYPQPEDLVSSPLKISGKARGSWFFEGDFSVVLTNWDGLMIAEGVAQAKGGWMTEDFVDFEAELVFEFDTTVNNRGSLILIKDNPSDLSENDDALEIGIYFKE